MTAQMETTTAPLGEAKLRSIGVELLMLTWLLVTMVLWLLAFLKLPSSDSVDWLRRTQLACFGTDESGFPSAAGWLVLTLGPLMFLAGLFVALPRECRAALDILRHRSFQRNCAVVIGIIFAVECSWLLHTVGSRIFSGKESINLSPEHLPEGYPMSSAPAPEFSLIDQAGRTTTLADLRRRPVILTFVFAHCASICPTLVQSVTSARRSAAAYGAVAVFITLDPWRDTPSRLPDLAKRWKLETDELLLSGTPEAVNVVLDSYGVPRSRDEKNGEVVHPALVMVINGDGKLSYSLNSPTVSLLRDAIERVAA